MEIKELLQSNILSKEEFRSAFVKMISDQEMNIREATIFSQVKGTTDELMLPTEFNDKVIKSVANYSEVIADLRNLFNIENGTTIFELPIANIVDDENVIGSIKLGQKTIINTVSIPEMTSLSEAETTYKFIFDLLTDKASKDLENQVFNADGTVAALNGLAVAGSGEAGAYVVGTDLVSTAAVTEANLISLTKMVDGNKNAHYYMNEDTFLDHVFPLMSTSKLISQDAEGRYLIGGRKIVLSDKVADDVIYLADLGYLVGNVKYRFGKKREFREGMLTFGLFVQVGLSPVISHKGFAKLEVTA